MTRHDVVDETADRVGLAPLRFTPLGDAALIFRVHEDFASDPEAALQSVTGAQRRLEAAAIPGVLEYAPAYDSIGVFFDPERVVRAGAQPEDIAAWVQEKITLALGRPMKKAKNPGMSRPLEIPVCYEGEFAPDLADVARQRGLPAHEVVRLHTSAAYRVHCVGFLPGFPYLGGLPQEIATARRVTPRKAVPAGSVAIGGAQTGIYPVNCPGGWNLIGRTPLRLFDPQREPAALLAPGDCIRFRAITHAEFQTAAR